MTHKLKILPRWFDEVAESRKRFEIRKADRDFKVGDWISLKEWKNGEYTGRSIEAIIEYIYWGDDTYGLPKGWCILGIDICWAHCILKRTTCEADKEAADEANN